MTDYEVLWRKACEACFAGGSDGSDFDAASVLRKAFEAKLTEAGRAKETLIAAMQRDLEDRDKKLAEVRAELIEAVSQRDLWRSNANALERLCDSRGRTITKQAAEIERLRAEADDRRDYTPDEIEIFQRCFDRGILDIDDLIHGTKAEKLARAKAALGGSNAK